MEGRHMRKNIRVAPREYAADWRDVATDLVEWFSSGFIGILLGSFVRCYGETPVWASISIGTIIALATRYFLKRLAEKY